MARATEGALAELHSSVAKALTARIGAEDTSAADLNAAIKFLKDNNITATPEGSSALKELSDTVGAQSIDPAGEEELQRALDNVVNFQQKIGHA